MQIRQTQGCWRPYVVVIVASARGVVMMVVVVLVVGEVGMMVMGRNGIIVEMGYTKGTCDDVDDGGVYCDFLLSFNSNGNCPPFICWFSVLKVRCSVPSPLNCPPP